METDEKKAVVFKIQNEEYAIGIVQVERIVDYEKITRIPDSPEYLKGIINNQGRIIPVIDLKRRFNLSDTGVNETSNIIIAKKGQGDIGIIVDSVSEVMDITEEMLCPPPDVVAGILKKYIKGIIKLDKRLIIYLDLTEILDFQEKKAIDAIIKQD